MTERFAARKLTPCSAGNNGWNHVQLPRVWGTFHSAPRIFAKKTHPPASGEVRAPAQGFAALAHRRIVVMVGMDEPLVQVIRDDVPGTNHVAADGALSVIPRSKDRPACHSTTMPTMTLEHERTRQVVDPQPQ